MELIIKGRERNNIIAMTEAPEYDNEKVVKQLSELLSVRFFSINAVLQMLGRHVDKEVMGEMINLDDLQTEVNSSLVRDWIKAEEEICSVLSLEEQIVLFPQAEYVLSTMFEDEGVAEVIDSLIQKNDPELIKDFFTNYVGINYDYSILRVRKH